jgi:predicted transcriptional regulator of viral defense system
MKELILLCNESERLSLKERMSYYAKKGYVFRLRRGLYAKNKEYNRYEVATKIMTPSYISFETVLLDAGITFQWYSRIFVASYQARIIECDGQIYHYRELKGEILTNNKGIKNMPHYSIATPERAFLDIVYLHKGYWFDNLSALNWEKVFDLVPLYQNKRVIDDADRYYHLFKEGQK